MRWPRWRPARPRARPPEAGERLAPPCRPSTPAPARAHVSQPAPQPPLPEGQARGWPLVGTVDASPKFWRF